MRVLSDSRHPSLAPGGSAPGCFFVLEGCRQRFLPQVKIPVRGRLPFATGQNPVSWQPAAARLPATGRNPCSWQPVVPPQVKILVRGRRPPCHRSKSRSVADGRPATGQNPGPWQDAAASLSATGQNPGPWQDAAAPLPATGRNPCSWQAALCHRSKSRFVAGRGGPSPCHRSESRFVAEPSLATGRDFERAPLNAT